MTDIPVNAQQFVIPSKIITTTNFDNDTIAFAGDSRFFQSSSVSASIDNSLAPRDISSHIKVNLNSAQPMNYSVGMSSPKYNRTAVLKIINTTFEEF